MKGRRIVLLCVALVCGLAIMAAVAPPNGGGVGGGDDEEGGTIHRWRQVTLNALSRRRWPKRAATLSAESSLQLAALVSAAAPPTTPEGDVVTTIASYAERQHLANWICIARRHGFAFVVGAADEFLVAWLALHFPTVRAVHLQLPSASVHGVPPRLATKPSAKWAALVGDHSHSARSTPRNFRHRMQLRLALAIALVDAGFDALFISVNALVLSNPIDAVAAESARGTHRPRGARRPRHDSILMYQQRETRRFPFKSSKGADDPPSFDIFYLSAGRRSASLFARAAAELADAKDWTRASDAVGDVLKTERAAGRAVHRGACGEGGSDFSLDGVATCELDPRRFADVYATKTWAIETLRTEEYPSPVVVNLFERTKKSFTQDCGYWLDHPKAAAQNQRCSARALPKRYCGRHDFYRRPAGNATRFPAVCSNVDSKYVKCPHGTKIATPPPPTKSDRPTAAVSSQVTRPLSPSVTPLLLPVLAADRTKIAALVKKYAQRCYVSKGKRPDLADVVIITVARFTHRESLANWMCAVERVGLDYMVLTPDAGLVVWLREHSPQSKVVMLQSPAAIKVPYLVQTVFLRLRAMLALVSAGKSVLYIGQDALVLQDPMTHLLPTAASIGAFDFRYQQALGNHFPFNASRGINVPGNAALLFASAGKRAAGILTASLMRMVDSAHAASTARDLTMWEVLWEAHDSGSLFHAGRCAGARTNTARGNSSAKLRTCELDPWIFPAGYAMQPWLTPWVQQGGIYQGEPHFGASGSPPMRPLVLSSTGSTLSGRGVVRFLKRCGYWFVRRAGERARTCVVMDEKSVGAFCSKVEFSRVKSSDEPAPKHCTRAGAFFDCTPQQKRMQTEVTLTNVELADALTLSGAATAYDVKSLTRLPLPSELEPLNVMVSGVTYNLTLLRNLAHRAAGCYADPMKRRPGISKVVISTLGNFAFRSQLTNWICFAQRLGFTFIVFAVDPQLGPWLDANFPDVLWIHIGASKFLENGADFSNFAAFRRGSYNVLMKVKLATTLSLLKIGYDNFYIDADCVILRDFVNDLLGEKGDDYRRIDLHYEQNHGTRFPYADSRGPEAEGNAGMFLAIASVRSIRVWEIAMRQMDARPDLDDQANLWSVIIKLFRLKSAVHHPPCAKVAKTRKWPEDERDLFTYCELDAWLYPTGYIAKAWITPMFQLGGIHAGTKHFGKSGTEPVVPFIVHPNFIRGEKHKVNFLKQCGYYLVAGGGKPDTDPLRCSAAVVPATFCGNVRFEPHDRYAKASELGWTVVDNAKKNAPVPNVHFNVIGRNEADNLLAGLVSEGSVPKTTALMPSGCIAAGTKYYNCALSTVEK